MYQKPAANSPKIKTNVKDTLETLRDSGSSKRGVFDQFFGDEGFEQYGYPREKEPAPKPKQEFKLFNYQEYYERELIKKQIKELTEQIRKEIEFIKKSNASLLIQVKDIERLTVESPPDKPGIYHIRFLEIVLAILRTLRAKIGESKTWLQALISKKKKRGSLFLVLSKKQGTQYSLSQELQAARSIQ
jgi:hypothetical protein